MASRVAAPLPSVTVPAPDLPADPTPTGTSRRAFLGRATVGLAAGGLVWAAPSILTIDAAAAASCGAGGTINWTNVTPTSPSSVTVGTVTASITHTDASGIGSSPDFEINSGSSFGGQSNAWYQLQILGAQTGQLQTVTFTFSMQVNSLSFTFFDIDQNTTTSGVGRYRDSVWVAGTNAANAAVATTATALGTNVAGAGTSANPFLPVNGSDNVTNGAGNATITFNAPVKTVTITYQARAPKNNGGTDLGFGNGNTGWASQRIGISNLNWTGCT